MARSKLLYQQYSPLPHVTQVLTTEIQQIQYACFEKKMLSEERLIMHTDEKTLSEILSAHRQHIIPVFQRPYSWSPRNWKELWSDIELLLEKGNESLEHFLGPIIIDKGDTGAYVPEKYLVIDGQQRLVTLSVILCALREIAEKHEDQDFASSVLPYLSFKTPRGEEYSRLVPRSADRVAFRKVVGNNFETGDGKLQIVKAYRFFLKVIREAILSNGIAVSDYLNELFEIVVARLKFVSITLEKSDDPTRIYESMNSKGKDLLVADLIRNYVLMHLSNGDTQDDFFKKQWEPFETIFANDVSHQVDTPMLEDFHYRFLVAKKAYFAKRLVYSKYKEHLKDYVKNGEPKEKKQSSLKLLVADQSVFASYYRRIVHPQLENDLDLRHTFFRFSFLDAMTATPFVMSLYARYDDDTHPSRISKATFLQMMNAMESFIIRRSVMRLRTRGYGLDFAQAVDKSGTLQQLWEHFDEKDWPTDDVIEEALVEFPLYLRERKKARLILEQLEISFGHKEQVDLGDTDKIQIEHILPQKKELSPEWKEMLGEDAYGIHEKYRDTLGNLTLTGYNQDLGAKSFADKQTEYSKHGSHLELNKYILEQDQWTEKEIVERAKELAKRVVEIWPRPKVPK